ncbi:Transcriptional regulator, GntR family protein [Sulfitobacter noctilucae]|uniref:GntR family transcriptional regulator n=1 Tax=Sulfitobacter noctilucae TaxID=1342302 RepID=UPI000469991B|nr:GntR family transcriptional regulator [Sulfitobacter noctilucae]KIN60535.1 Transcriptional regulator, GntR family protein [Sulfitobacter noctilucae]
MMSDTGPSPIQRKSLHLELVDRLQPLIIGGELVPGSKVPEKELCDRFGVSRTPMREALKVLASDGLIRLEPNRGAWVTIVTISEVEEVFPVLGALEALSGKLACESITPAELDEVSDLHAQMIASYERRDLDAYFSINQKIHRAILMAARNDTLTASCQALSLRMQRARYLANMTEGRWYDAVQEHERILQYLLARDGENLAQTLLEHMEAKRQSVVRWLQAQEQEAAE